MSAAEEYPLVSLSWLQQLVGSGVLCRTCWLQAQHGHRPLLATCAVGGSRERSTVTVTFHASSSSCSLHPWCFWLQELPRALSEHEEMC